MCIRHFCFPPRTRSLTFERTRFPLATNKSVFPPSTLLRTNAINSLQPSTSISKSSCHTAEVFFVDAIRVLAENGIN